MPLFRKSPEPVQKARLEHKLRIAKDTPETTFDLSECGATQVPQGVFSMCRVFRKEELLLNRNSLTTLKGGGVLQDLSALKSLDLSFNKFASLPDEIGQLTGLQTINLRSNLIKTLPKTFANLKSLENLDLSENLFKQIPDCVSQLSSLKCLWLNGNGYLNHLPSNFVQLSTLSELNLDCEKFVYPPAEICSEGTEAIRKFICNDQQIEYQAPSQDSASSSRGASVSSQIDSPDETPLPTDTFHQHQLAKDRRRQDLIEMEEDMRRNEQTQFELSAENVLRRQELLNNFKQEQDRFNSEILQVQNRKEMEKSQLLGALYDLELHSALLITDLLDLNERARSSDAIAMAIERDRIEAEELFTIKQIELEDSRKQDVLLSMKETLAAEEKQRAYEARRLEQTRKNTMSPLMQDKRIRDLLTDRELDQQALFNQLMDEEELQRLAFHALQVQRDAQHFNLTHQIKLIERELMKLSEAEIHRQDKRTQININFVAEQRTTLAELLATLLTQRESREELLKQRLREMEDHRVEEIKDYWLIQYQKLMDRKPQEILDMELAMDPTIRQLLIQSGGQHYLTKFAAAEVTLEQIAAMDNDQLYALGVTDSRIRSSILAAAREAFNSYEPNICQMPSSEKLVPISSPLSSPAEPSAPSPLISPSAPEATSPDQEETPSVSKMANLSRIWHQAECVVCMDRESNIVFLPCGHVCSCWPCAKDIDLCPLCRIDVHTKLTIGTI